MLPIEITRVFFPRFFPLKHASLWVSQFLETESSNVVFVSSYSSILANQSPNSGTSLSSFNDLTLFSC